MDPISYDRRTILAAGSVALAGLAGCLGDAAGDGSEDTDESSSESGESEYDSVDELGSDDEDELVRTDERDGVNFEVVFVNPLLAGGADDHPLREEARENLVFEVSMDAHSGDLTAVDWSERSRLRTSAETEVDDPEWVWVRESDHHPVGYFRVPKTPVDGEPIVHDETTEIELVIEMDEGTASFSWGLGARADGEAASKLYTYVTNAYDGTVSVIDHEDRSVVETVSVADRTSHGIAIDPDGTTVYVGDSDDGTIYPISTDDFEVGAPIEVGSNAHGIDVDPDGRYLYVSGGSVETRGDVAVVDFDDHEVIGGIETDGAGHVNFDPEGRYAYVSNVDLNRIAVVDTEEMELLETVSVGDGPNEAVASPDGTVVYTANVEDDSVSVIDVETWEEVDRISAGEGTHGVDVTPNGDRVWTANRGSNDLTVIDADSRDVIETITDVDGANHLAISPDGSTVYATAPGSDETFVVDSRTFEVLDTIEVGGEPHEIVFGPGR